MKRVAAMCSVARRSSSLSVRESAMRGNAARLFSAPRFWFFSFFFLRIPIC